MSLGSTLDPRVTTARSLTLEAETDSPLEVRSGTIAVGDVPTGQPRPVPVPIAVPSDLKDGEYEVNIELSYQYTRTIVPGYTHFDSSKTDEFTVTVIVDDDAVIPAQDISITGLSGSLQVGYEGQITGTLTNLGPDVMDDGVVQLQPETSRITVDESKYALPNLSVGESTQVQFYTEVNEEADPGPRQFQFIATYDDGQATTRTTGRLQVEPHQPAFSLDTENATIPAGSSRDIRFTLTNNRPEPVTAISAKLFANSPLSRWRRRGLHPTLGSWREYRVGLSGCRSTDRPVQNLSDLDGLPIRRCIR
ncbi:MAG: hypothetical protein U5K37_08330 [Natrialbaceae archaeon]|nr:hypothetical protein [Natrialbaceae archaeon]